MGARRDRNQVPVSCCAGTVNVPILRKSLPGFRYPSRPARTQKDTETISSDLFKLLFRSADYPSQSQNSAISFFRHNIIPYLGGSIETSQWHSFMTDDGTPIELSWDWSNSQTPPNIRFSLEPIGPQSGSRDPSNLLAPKEFQDRVVAQLPSTKLEWFDHFSRDFVVGQNNHAEGHSSKLFYAFDMKRNGDMIAKAYFLPRFKAALQRISVWDAIQSSVRKAPGCTSQNLHAFDALHEFFHQEQDIDLEMLSIDLGSPTTSRIKIYFRSHRTDFASVKRIMTFNGTRTGPKHMEGIQKLHKLWMSIFECSALMEAPLPSKSHRTAGVLYYADFRLGDELPKVKLYIPVRHYARSDSHICQAVTTFQVQQGHGKYVQRYKNILAETL
ncbi:aromatic prenyltransferase [Periconia macrospinosa]|uniref:Aromatic prenyltransferase n=1 Tax=Periconia macrospinosa TaxID=97972 RepID=A0A2V1DXR7_9PLEO|nr:aromatic prenyltransferase [Periconia macrospinosa]